MKILTSVKRLYISFKSLVKMTFSNDYIVLYRTEIIPATSLKKFHVTRM